MSAAPPSRSAVFAAALLVLMAAFMAWAYQSFIDADYENAWWVLTTLMDSPLSDANAIQAWEATGMLLCSMVLITVAVAASSQGSREHRVIVSALIALLWVTSPWHLAAIQTGGAQRYLLFHLPVLAVFFRLRTGPRLTWLCLLLALLVNLVIQVVLAAGWTWSLPTGLLLPATADLLPWASPQSFSSNLELSLLWLGLHLLTPVADASLGRLRSALIPITISIAGLATVNATTVAEQLQIRANPRLALLYSLAYVKQPEEPNAMLAWLAMEHFDSIGGAEQFTHYRAVLGRVSAEDKLPDAYRTAVLCVQGASGAKSPANKQAESQADTGETSRPEPMGIESELVLRYLDHHDRCGEKGSESTIP